MQATPANLPPPCMMSPAVLLHLTLVSVLLAAIVEGRCRSSLDCSDGNPATADVCLPFGRCINIHSSRSAVTVRQEGGGPTFFRTSREEITSLANADPISLADRKAALQIMATIAGGFNPHRFMQLNLIKFDPVKAFKKLSKRLQSGKFTNLEFYEEVTDIFQRMDDRHTRYFRPEPLSGSLAVQGFVTELFYEPGAADMGSAPSRRYAVSEVNSFFNFTDKFEPGVELLTWNGAPVDDVVQQFGDTGYGANPSARSVLGNGLLTVRNLRIDPFPETDSVEITFRSLAGEVLSLTAPWVYIALVNSEEAETTSRMSPVSVRGSDLQREDFHKDPARSAGWLPKISVHVAGNRTSIPIQDATVADSLSAEIIPTSVGDIGRLDLRSFPNTNSSILAEYARVFRLFPPNGLIIDIRGNNGGSPDTVKAILEFLTGVDVPELSVNIRATKLTEQLVLSDDAGLESSILDFFNVIFKPFQGAIRSALQVHERFTGPGPDFLTPLGRVKQPQVYFGPIIAVADGKTYSAGDLIAANIVDTRVAELVGVGNSTGGGGASTLLYPFLPLAFPDILKQLPNRTGSFSTSYARVYRSGEKAGKFIERFGVPADTLYFPTLNDAISPDCDLIEFLARRLTSSTSEPSPSAEEVM